VPAEGEATSEGQPAAVQGPAETKEEPKK